jgi:hypothetical protein
MRNLDTQKLTQTKVLRNQEFQVYDGLNWLFEYLDSRLNKKNPISVRVGEALAAYEG